MRQPGTTSKPTDSVPVCRQSVVTSAFKVYDPGSSGLSSKLRSVMLGGRHRPLVTRGTTSEPRLSVHLT